MEELRKEELRWVCDPRSFSFQMTDDDELSLPEPGTIINQDRARKAIEFALGVQAEGFNVYVVGQSGVGRKTLVEQILEKVAPTRPTPDDICLVFNFDDPWLPLALPLPAGQGKRFAAEMEEFIREIETLIETVLTSSEIEQIRSMVQAEFHVQGEHLVEEFRSEAAEAGYNLPPGPLRSENIPPDLRPRFVKLLWECQKIEQEGRREIRASSSRLIEQAISSRLESLMGTYGVAVEDFLRKVAEDIAENYEVFAEGSIPPPYGRYQVNLLVDNSGTSGAPIVFEPNPTRRNLQGAVEYIPAGDGAMTTNHTLVRPGALHWANGGFLVLEIRELMSLKNPFSYDDLKQALKTGEIRLEPLDSRYGFPAKSLKPEPVPLDIKVILLGERVIFEYLGGIDPDFRDLFKIRAEFETEMPRTPETEEQYATFIKVRGEQAEVLPFDRAAVAAVVEYGSRLAGDQEKLSLQFGLIDDLLQEASRLASQKDTSHVTVDDVRQALEDRTHRLKYIEERIRELIAKGTLLIEVEGEAIGQVNGLAILTVNSDYEFGIPSRITARTFVGRKGVVDIAREAEMGGSIHTKGILILSGYLGGRYAQKRSLSLSASLTFEQSYRLIEGDSASAAELFALLSSLAEISLKQNIAVTGSVDHRGQIQPVAGINEKIEGFFDTCRVKGLTGEQGVIIPAANIRNLMLREDVVEAVDRGQFHVWPIKTVDEGITLLAGVLAGELEEDGTYPEGTVNRAIADKLSSYAELLKGEKDN